MWLLRLLQRQGQRDAARSAVRYLARRDRTTRARGLGARRRRGLHAGRHPSELHRRQISRHLPGREKRGTRHPHPRVLTLEVHQGAATLGVPVENFLRSLQATGLDTLPGTAAEILDDEVRAVLCPDKIHTDQWLEVMRAAHRSGLRSTATIMFGHVDRYEHWARHLLRIRQLQ